MEHCSGDNVITFSYVELAKATRNFGDKPCIGGRLGPVYMGILESTGEIIAVKSLRHSGSHDVRMFQEEVTRLSRLRHRNLVNLIGYCADGLLVYEFFYFRSLESTLHDGSSVLDWNTRMRIAFGVAKGLNYLHNENDPPVIFRDLKSSNIFLDQEFHPRLSDFGLTMFETPQVSTRRIKTDVYNFGVVLLELISGMIQGNGRHMELVGALLKKPKATFTSLADVRMQSYPVGSLHKAVEVVLMCMEDDTESRPNMKDVVERLAALVE